ncbi:MAG: hypothetical protein P8P83_03975 [Rickettsiaceae bacterium]|nr:hypothetical protein [Rickettsiaceae bacterium]
MAVLKVLQEVRISSEDLNNSQILVGDEGTGFCQFIMSNLHNNNIGNSGALTLIEALKTNSNLTGLSLIQARIGNSGALALAEALKTNSILTSLNFSVNDIDEEGAVVIAKALKENRSLESLELSGNNIGSDGAVALAEALKTNSTLTCLTLVHSSIGSSGALALAEALKTNSTLISLSTAFSDIEESGVNQLGELTDRNRLIQKAVLDNLTKIAAGNDVTDVDIRDITNINHIEFLTDYIINPLDRYLENEKFFKKKLQESGLDIEILEANATYYQSCVNYSKASPLLKTKDSHIPNDLEGDIVKIRHSSLHSYLVLGTIGGFLNKKDTGILKMTSSNSKKTAANLPDGSGGGGITIEEMVNEAEKNKISERIVESEANIAQANSLWDMNLESTGAAEEPVAPTGQLTEATEVSGF